ncbi:hypothetical protein M3643_13675 [Staphylococcus lugdunensis]|nr:hypothetical protein [Staphylococcus lugdunensis]
MNAANEVAVEAFLERRIGFMAIARRRSTPCSTRCRTARPTGSTTSSRRMPRLAASPPRSLRKRLRHAWSVLSEWGAHERAGRTGRVCGGDRGTGRRA